ncbi:MAG TPA: hypothetical protein VI259_16435 [Gemmatimonadaceae bacterium]
MGASNDTVTRLSARTAVGPSGSDDWPWGTTGVNGGFERTIVSGLVTIGVGAGALTVGAGALAKTTGVFGGASAIRRAVWCDELYVRIADALRTPAAPSVDMTTAAALERNSRRLRRARAAVRASYRQCTQTVVPRPRSCVQTADPFEGVIDTTHLLAGLVDSETSYVERRNEPAGLSLRQVTTVTAAARIFDR